MTGDQNKDHISTRQLVSRHSSRPNVFYFFPTAQNILKFSHRTNGTFGFAPTAQADTKAKPKEPFFANALMTFFNYIKLTLQTNFKNRK